jgi:hypothetical protein
MAQIDQKFSFPPAGPATLEMHAGNTVGGTNPAGLHDGAANVPPTVVIGGTGKQLRIDTQYARITNPA